MKQELLANLASAGLILVLTLGLVIARKLGLIDADTVTRLVIGSTGLWMVWSGNRMPKTMVPRRASAQRARRVASWSLVLSGLVYAGLWAFAPIPVATWGGCAAVLTGIAVTFGYCLSLPKTAKAG